MSSRVEAFSVGDEPEVVIRQSAGSVKVVEGEAGTVTVSIHGGGADKVPIEQFGDRIEIGTEGKVRGSFTTVLSVPPATRMAVALASASFTAAAPIAGLELKSASSRVAVRDVRGDCTIKLASGDVDLGTVFGRTRVASASGDIRVKQTDAHCSCSTASGDVEIDRANDTVEMKTASGDLLIHTMLGEEVQAKSMSGDVEIGIPAGTRVELNLKTVSGRVDLPEPPTTRTEEPQRRAEVSAKSLSGDITIKRA